MEYFALSIIMVAASIVATVVSLNFHHTNAANANEMPKYVSIITKFLLLLRLSIYRFSVLLYEPSYVRRHITFCSVAVFDILSQISLP